MILALVESSLLRAAVESSARWDEDVVTDRSGMGRVLRVSSPRALVVDDEHALDSVVAEARAAGVPIVRLGAAEIRRWEMRRRERVPPPGRARFYGAQLRRTLPEPQPSWVDRLLSTFTRAAGRTLPFSFRAVARRVLEDPARYTTLEGLVPVIRISSPALRARFRRRDLPSPLEYLRWLRLLAVVHHLQVTGESVSTTAVQLGFHSSGNLARFTRSVCGRTPTALRGASAPAELVVEVTDRLFRREDLDRWDSLDRLFPREA
ncbi:AraC family transcriptional regulator [Gaopeijia maritima]|uniref:Helix-turn-helix domain-containing protein n=1 Tax=Gaopeijia maritima TaxID=3119007 RepID=A0ABU9EBF6_9BACT